MRIPIQLILAYPESKHKYIKIMFGESLLFVKKEFLGKFQPSERVSSSSELSNVKSQIFRVLTPEQRKPFEEIQLRSS
jgi:hypothetical protein